LVSAGALSPKATIIATYALCGFANFSSIAIQIGGISPMAENRRSDIAKLGLKSVLGGTLATWMTASIAGMLAG
jgi:CNT family concentrative nucleoside transporter